MTEIVKRNEWQEFFDGYAPHYNDECFTKATLVEVDFIITELDLKPGMHILDLGCGSGRHAVEFARRGYRITGVDLSAGMLAEARKATSVAGVELELIQCDAANFHTSTRFDAAVCLCEGAFGLLGSRDDFLKRDTKILCNISAALKPGAGFVLTALNGMRKILQYTNEDVKSGIYDPILNIEKCVMEWETPSGRRSVTAFERGFVPGELILMFQCAGLKVCAVWGGTAGDWGKRPLDLDEIEIMIIARK